MFQFQRKKILAQKDQAGLDLAFNLIAIVIKYQWNREIFLYLSLSNNVMSLHKVHSTHIHHVHARTTQQTHIYT